MYDMWHHSETHWAWSERIHLRNFFCVSSGLVVAAAAATVDIDGRVYNPAAVAATAAASSFAPISLMLSNRITKFSIEFASKKENFTLFTLGIYISISQ